MSPTRKEFMEFPAVSELQFEILRKLCEKQCDPCKSAAKHNPSQLSPPLMKASWNANLCDVNKWRTRCQQQNNNFSRWSSFCGLFLSCHEKHLKRNSMHSEARYSFLPARLTPTLIKKLHFENIPKFLYFSGNFLWIWTLPPEVESFTNLTPLS